MHLTHQLFSPEEAFVRLGQTRHAGCLVIVSAEQSAHLFVENGEVVSASAGHSQGPEVLDKALNQTGASYVWIPDSKPQQKTMAISIVAFALKNAIAKDVRIAITGKVCVPFEENNESRHPNKNSNPNHYLIAADNPNQKLFIAKPTVVLGREPSCEIVLDNTQVSRKHCLMEIVSEGISVRDLDSRNGIKINGVTAKEGFLNHEDTLELGTYAIKFYKGN
jgi:hypothetical protein